MTFFFSGSRCAAALGAGMYLTSAALGAEAPDKLSSLFDERVRSVVAVEYFVETEIDRRPAAELGLVIDDEGLILLADSAIPGWVPVDRLKEFRVSPLRTRERFEAVYLGQESLNGWHFIRVENEALHEVARPITDFETAVPRMGDELWGIAVMDEDYDFEPFFLSSRFSLLRELPQSIAFTTGEVASPGSLVFSLDGSLVGWAGASFLTEALLHIRDDRIPVAIQTLRESGAFLPIAEVLPFLDRVPESPRKRATAWIGISSLQPVEREVAEFLGLTDRAGVILGEIIEGSPADLADLLQGDIVTAIDGERIPSSYRPREAVTHHLQREVLKRRPGDRLNLTIQRGTEEMEREVEVGLQPPTLRDARREYFPKIGFTAREFLLFDGVARRVGPEPDRGLVVQFVRPNGPAHTAGLSTGDWIREVDGFAISSYPEAIDLIAKAEREERRETVFLVERNNETSVIRIRLR